MTEADKAAGWKLLFDGKATTGWRGYKKDKAPDGWQVIDGTLVRVKRGGDLLTVDQFQSFDLVLDWRISRAGNSGVIYHVTEDDDHASRTGPECQILDNIDGEDPKRAGWCYALYQPPDDPKTGKPLDTTKPVGQWNTMRILIDGNHVEHWMNGVKYVEYELNSDDWNSRVAKSKFRLASLGQIQHRPHRPPGPQRGSGVPEYQDTGNRAKVTGVTNKTFNDNQNPKKWANRSRGVRL